MIRWLEHSELEIVDQWSTKIPPPSRGGEAAAGQFVISIEHHSKPLGFYLPIYKGNVLMKFGFDVQSQTEKSNMAVQRPFWKWHLWKSIGFFP